MPRRRTICLCIGAAIRIISANLFRVIFCRCSEIPSLRRLNTGSGRLDLANQIASAANPLTARVIVNRIWHHHFGAGLVTKSE